VIDFLEKVQPLGVKGILPVFLDPETGSFVSGMYLMWRIIRNFIADFHLPENLQITLPGVD
jgi:hypothetical protein